MHTILVADDSVTIQRAVEIVFDKEPFTVVKVGSASAAMAAAKASRPALILADHTMADGGGYDIAAALRADPDTAGIPVVLLSAAAHPFDEARGAAAGIVGSVQKPFDCATLLDRVRTILGVEATAPGTFVSPANTSTASAINMPRPPSLGGLPRPPGGGVPSFLPRPSLPNSPGIPAPQPSRSLDPFGLGAATSQVTTPAAAPAAAVSTPPTSSFSSPFSSPAAVSAPAAQPGWQAMSHGQGLPASTQPPAAAQAPAIVQPVMAPSAPTPQASTPSWLPTAPTPAPVAPAAAVAGFGQSTGLAELSDFDLGVTAPVAVTRTATPAPIAVPRTPTPTPAADLAKSTARIAYDDIARAEAAAVDLTPSSASPFTRATDAVVAAAGPAIAAATGEVPSQQALSAEAKAIIERIVWEVVPELAEVIIKEELQRLLKARGH